MLNFDALDVLGDSLVDTSEAHGFFVGILSVSDVLVLEFFELCGDCESWASIVSQGKLDSQVSVTKLSKSSGELVNRAWQGSHGHLSQTDKPALCEQ